MAAGAVAMLLAAQQGGAIAKVVKGAPPKPVSTQRFAVDMWWNVGGDMGGLQKATEACVKRLGDHERPVRISPPPSTTILSKPMLDCLEGEGWRPAGEPRPV
jgi:hypothetical protein